MTGQKMIMALAIGLGLTLALAGILGRGTTRATPDATYTVTTTVDENNGCGAGAGCSLREAIIAANSDGQADTIVLGAGTYTLTLVGTDDTSALGDLDIVGSGDLSITGEGPDNTIIDAAGIDRVIHIFAEASVVISGVTIMGGDTTGDGGGIYDVLGRLDLTNVTIISNSASNGGGLYAAWGGFPTLNQVEIVSNVATIRGGGVALSGGNAVLTLTSGIIAHNAANEGGGLSIGDGTALLRGGQIVDNVATGTGGGAWVGNAAHAELDGVQVVNNNAASGGGVGIHVGSLLVSGGVISGNTTTGSGAGVHCSWGQVTQSGGLIISNTAAGNGGGLYLLTTSAFTQTGGAIARNRSHRCGGIQVGWTNALLLGGEISENHADDHGGGLCITQDTGRVILNGGQILSNTATNRGGGVIVDNASAVFTMTSGLVAYNRAEGTIPLYGGGGIYVRYGRAVLNGGQVRENQANYGGGVHISSSDAALLVNGGQIENNTATEHGGGILVGISPVTIERGHITHNSAGEGGGVYCNDSLMTVTNATISGNTAYTDGAAIANVNGTILLTHTTIASNSVTAAGSGIALLGGGSITARNSIIAYNSPSNCNTAIGSNGYNIIDSDVNCSLGAVGDTVADPLLAPLAYDYDTMVHAITHSSPAHDAAPCVAGITTDQRGVLRIPPCDIGAYELTLYAPELAIIKEATPGAVVSGGAITYLLTVTNSGNISASLLVITDALPAGVSFVSASDGGILVSNVVSWTATSLEEDSWLTRTFVVTATETITNDDYAVAAEGVPAVRGAVEVVTLVDAPPVADAGASQEVPVGAYVQLDGSGSFDPEGGALNYRWAQTGGTGITLSNSSAISPTFSAPLTPDILTFTLAVTDTFGTVRFDITNVAVRCYIHLPLVLRD